MQNLAGLQKLRALNIIHFRNDDTCVWVMRETRRFIVDNLSHYPNLKLEWISIDDERVERILRVQDSPKKPAKDKKDKGKAKALQSVMNGLTGISSSIGDTLPPMPFDGWDSSSDSEDDYMEQPSKVKLETVEGVQFCDVWDVRIFKKEVMAGRL
jgi:hypothetical protein